MASVAFSAQTSAAVGCCLPHTQVVVTPAKLQAELVQHMQRAMAALPGSPQAADYPVWQLETYQGILNVSPQTGAPR